jgi:hypothetical protein
MSIPKTPTLPKAPSTPISVDDPAILAAREDSMKKQGQSGFMNLIMGSSSGSPQSAMKKLLGL